MDSANAPHHAQMSLFLVGLTDAVGPVGNVPREIPGVAERIDTVFVRQLARVNNVVPTVARATADQPSRLQMN